MQRTKSILAVLMAIPLGGCLLRGKPNPPPAAPIKPVANAPVSTPPAPPPLSIPQTHAQLPAPQPVPEEALATNLPPEEGTPPSPAPTAKPPSRRPISRQGPVAPVEPPAAPPAVIVEPGRAPIQEVLPAEQQNQLREQTNASRRESHQIVLRVQSRRPNKEQRDLIARILGLLKNSEDRERGGDLAGAKQLADKALTLAKGL